jgi:CRP-like cAMP-binding protein
MSRGRSRFPALLANLTATEYRRIHRALRPVVLAPGQVLLTPGRQVRTLYFLCDGVCSIRQVMKSGRTVEIAMVGNEGIVGIEAIFGVRRARYAAIVRHPDARALAMDVRVFDDQMRSKESFERVTQRYAYAFLNSVMQSAACNAVHAVDARCARWLLTMRDRVGRDEFPFTQAAMAAALGVRRPTVTLAVAELQRKGLIDYWRHGLVIRSPSGLMTVSCECRDVLRKLLR